jgi:hypothetical protein
MFSSIHTCAGQQLVQGEPLRLDPRARVLALQRHLSGGGGQRWTGLDQAPAELVAALPGDRPGRVWGVDRGLPRATAGPGADDAESGGAGRSL